MLLGLPANYPDENYALLMYLRRTHPQFSHVEVDSVCEAHHQGVHNNPIHPLTDEDKFSTVATRECGAARLFDLGASGPGPDMEVNMNLSFPCRNSCIRGIHLTRIQIISH